MEKESVLLNIFDLVENEAAIGIAWESVDAIIGAEFGIDYCLKMLEEKGKDYWCCEEGNPKWKVCDFKEFDEYEMTACSFKLCINNTMSYFAQILPIKPKSNNESAIKTLFLDSVLNAEYEKMMDFSAKIYEYKKEFNLSPDDFKMKYNLIEIQKSAFNILTNVKHKLIAVKSINDTELSLPEINSTRCPIYISIDLKTMLQRAINKAAPDKILIITGSTVHKFYGMGYFIRSFVKDSYCEIYEYIIDNASKKTLSQVQDVLRFAEEKRLTRKSLIILFGGGSVGSIGGMASKLYVRGIKYIYVPTTLLSQIDCAIGCKHSVNGYLGKNKFGVYNLPESVIINPLIGETLCIEQKKSGLIEALKHGLCQSKALLDKISNYSYACFNIISLTEIITETITCKLEYMKEDPYASSPELPMEFGHKVAHALEFLSEESMPHGICVAFGMVAEARLFSVRFRESNDTGNILAHIIETVKKVVPYIELSCEYTNKKIADAVLYDNKREKDAIPFIRLVSEQNPSVTWINEDDNFMHQLEESIGFARECFRKTPDIIEL